MPLVLTGVAIGVAAFVASDRIGHAYLFGSGLIAMAITLRFTWERRSQRHYWLVVTGFAACQGLIVYLIGDHAQRAAGAIYMGLALMEALAMTLLINAVTKPSSPSN